MEEILQAIGALTVSVVLLFTLFLWIFFILHWEAIFQCVHVF